MENLPQMRDAGWRHYHHRGPGMLTEVELSRAGAASGEHGLRMRAAHADPSREPGQVETPPVWITSAPVRLSPGQIVRISGRVRIPERIAGSTDGLLVIDSLGGEPLAQRIRQTDGWQEFSAYRAAGPRGAVLTLTLALSGMGEVFLDDLSVTAFEPIAR